MIERVINMKKKKKYVFETIKILILIFVAFYILSSTIEVKKSVFDGLQRCIQTIIPSLYAVMALSGIIARSCILEKISSPIDTFSRKIFGMNGNVFIIFIMSMVSGYPVGVKMLSEMYEKGNITKKQCELYSGLCYGAGPAFITGCAASSFTGNYAGKIILISNICANTLIAIFLGKFIGMEKKINCRLENSKTLNVNEICSSISDAGHNILTMCGMIIFFNVIIDMLDNSRIYTQALSNLNENSDLARKIIRCIFDISSAADFTKLEINMLPIISGCIAFGGICVIFQVKMIAGNKFSMKKMIFLRLIAAAMSIIISEVLIHFFVDESQCAASVSVFSQRIAAVQPSASLVILLMTFILFNETENLFKTLKNS